MSAMRVPADEFLARTIPEFATSAEALGAVAAIVSLRASREHVDRDVERALQETADALGLTEVIDSLGAGELAAIGGLIRARIMYAASLGADPARPPGWAPHDPATMVGEGLASREVANVLDAAVVPELPGLSDRLRRPGGALLDVGVGVGGLAIRLCRLYPYCSAVGIDIWEPALSLAGRFANDAGVSGRLTLRTQNVTELNDKAAYDLGWLPVGFVGRERMPEALRRIRIAMRPGGWIVLGLIGGPTRLAVALAQLRAARMGGTFLRPAEAEQLLRDAGWTDIRSLPPGLIRSLWLTAGRQPSGADPIGQSQLPNRANGR